MTPPPLKIIIADPLGKLWMLPYGVFRKHSSKLRFSKTRQFWSSKANWRLCFSLTDLLWTNFYFNGLKRSSFVVCDWWISIRFVCFCVSRFVACDSNYDWRQRKTQLWRRHLNFRVLYSTANDPQPQMIPKMDRKWSSTASDQQSRQQMIPKEIIGMP